MAEPRMTRREFTSTRVLDAPRELVWKAWTEPEQLAQWWGPKGLSTPRNTIELDLRPGGVFKLTMVSDGTGSEFPSDMQFREVVEPERIVFGWEAQRGLGAGEVTVTFNDLGDRTEMTTRFVGYQTEEIARASQVGWSTQIDKLAEHLAAKGAIT
ncbi:MAG: SRPBCC family protein [Solirubrobacteraceae bacterium]